MQRRYIQQKTKMPACLQAVHSFLHSTATRFSETLLWARQVLGPGDARMTEVVKVLAFIQKMEISKQNNI